MYDHADNDRTRNADQKIKKVEAEAEATAIITRAEAEAEANRKISESLTQGLIDYTYAQAWDGKLPTFMGESGVIPFLNAADYVEETPVVTQPATEEPQP